MESVQESIDAARIGVGLGIGHCSALSALVSACPCRLAGLIKASFGVKEYVRMQTYVAQPQGVPKDPRLAKGMLV